MVPFVCYRDIGWFIIYFMEKRYFLALTSSVEPNFRSGYC
ncbi:hypothetical protein GEOBRER4_n3617 [Citrifermentans bremense]|uniref:Uncharacterized protein n=1 Tax=Citrifermentans bremense TaxID=60035 RepID=A0A7R7FSK5_9BACT|nr:hypothetical protein GEOBRER4_n3617 [Citrifermentans bremense]